MDPVVMAAEIADATIPVVAVSPQLYICLQISLDNKLHRIPKQKRFSVGFADCGFSTQHVVVDKMGFWSHVCLKGETHERTAPTRCLDHRFEFARV